LPVPKLEKFIGIEVYVTSSLGIGGVIRQSAEDFVVEEVLVDGSKAEVNQTDRKSDYLPLGSHPAVDRYLLCVLVKRNWDTFQAIRAIAQHLGISTRRIHIAGIKDAKAITTQHVTIEGVRAEELQKVQVKDVTIQPLGYFHSKISSYFLLGNQFHIVIRAMNHSESVVKERITKTLEEINEIGGVPNFFGHQRFGTVRPITHLVGKAIVQGNLEKAAMVLLAKSSSYEHPESRRVREQLKTTQDFKQALRIFPKQLRYERLILRHLAENPQDFVGAFRRLPIRLRRLFPQAYQAYLFNKFLSRRVKCGLPLNGAEVGDYAVHVELSGLPTNTMHKIVETQMLAEVNKAIQAGRMHVAIPLIGLKQQPSKGFQGEIEKQILEEEQVSSEDFKIAAVPEISARGKLRTAKTTLNNFLLAGTSKDTSKDTANPSKRKAEVDFMLHRGSYATVVLRELMKPYHIITAGF
jgi:tRNA pseudouridine13 synthase